MRPIHARNPGIERAGAASPWFVRHSAARSGGQRLFCFPYAGGSANIFRAWAQRLPPSVEVIGVQAPGKGSRMLDPPYKNVHALVDGLLDALTPMLHEKPFSLFGHSNGALIAFELSCMLQRHGLPLPRRLFLSASPAPWVRVFDKPYSQMNDAEFKSMLKDFNGTPSEILDDVDLFQLLLPGLRADFSMSEGYLYTHGRKLAVPVDVYHGAQDDIEPAQIHAWSEHIASLPRFEQIPGDHFYIHSHIDQLTESIARRLDPSSGATAPLPGPLR